MGRRLSTGRFQTSPHASLFSNPRSVLEVCVLPTCPPPPPDPLLNSHRDTFMQVMFREHRESSSISFRELPGSMLGTALHVYRRASAAPGAGVGGPQARDGGGVAGSAATRGRGGAALRGRGGVGKGHMEAPPQSFALLTSMGYYHGSLALGSQVKENERERMDRRGAGSGG